MLGHRGQRFLQRQLVVQFAGDARLLLFAHAGRFGGERSQFRERAHPLGHVAQDHGIELAFRRLQLRDGGFDREFAAVLAQRIKHRVVAHAARGRAGGAEAPDLLAVAAPVPLGNQQIERLAAHFARGPAEHLFGGAVVQHDALAVVGADDSVHGGIEQAGEPRGGVLG
jgi:hypothetical protein